MDLIFDWILTGFLVVVLILAAVFRGKRGDHEHEQEQDIDVDSFIWRRTLWDKLHNPADPRNPANPANPAYPSFAEHDRHL